jgi:hypothetical protein
MWDLLTGTLMQRLVIFAGLGSILDTADIYWNDTRWWAFFILIIVLEFIAHGKGMLLGTTNILSMHKTRLLEIKDFLDSLENGEDRKEEELINILKKEEDDHK